MIIREKLAENGIHLKSLSVGENRTICPQCSTQRKKKTDPCLAVRLDDDGGAVWMCHHCGWTGNVPSPDRSTPHRHEIPTTKVDKPMPILNPEYPKEMYDWFRGRGISPETVKQMKIFQTERKFNRGHQLEKCFGFPYLHNGEVKNHKYRSVDKKFSQDAGAERTLYNVDALKDAETGYFVEGEVDVLAMIEAGFSNTVSLPDGAPKKVEKDPGADGKRYAALKSCGDDIEHIKKWIIATDMDGPGRALAEELARRLGKERCYLAKLSRKDANEVLMQDGADTLRSCLDAAEPYPITGLYTAEHYREGVLDVYQNQPGKGLSTGWLGLDEYYTIREGDLTIVTGIPNHGKSELLDALVINLAINHGWRSALCSFENIPEFHIAKLAEKITGEPFFEGPIPRMGPERLSDAIDTVDRFFHFIRADEEAPTIDWILEKARAAVLRYGIRGLVIDPWNEVEHTRSNGMTETEYVSYVLGKVRRFAQVNGVHVWFVAHPKMLQKENGQRPVPSPYDISGSAHWANKADFALTVHRPDPDSNLAEIHVMKVRHKWLGKQGCVTLRYNPETGEYFDDMEPFAA